MFIVNNLWFVCIGGDFFCVFGGIYKYLIVFCKKFSIKIYCYIIIYNRVVVCRIQFNMSILPSSGPPSESFATLSM